MSGRFFVTLMLFVLVTAIALLILFNFYPPAANSWWTLAVLAVDGVLAWRVARRAAKG